MTPTRRVLSVLALTIAIAAPMASGPVPGVAVAASALPSAAPADGKLSAELALTAVTPSAVTAKTPLTVTGTIRNPGTGPLPPSTITLRLRGGLLADRDAVRAWTEAGTATGPSRTLAGTARVAALPAGQSAPFRVVVPAGDLDLPAAFGQFGPRGLVVEATTAGERSAALRTTVVWFPGKEFSPTRLSFLVPLTSTPSTDVAAASAGAAVQLAPTGRLQRALDATADRAVAWAVDPAVLLAADRLRNRDAASSPTTTPGATATASTPPVTSNLPAASTPSAGAGGPVVTREAADATAWLARFAAGSQGRELLGLPFADPDLTALVRNRSGALLSRADALGRDVTEEVLGRPIETDIAFPAGGGADVAALSALSRRGRTSAVLGSSAQPPIQDVSYTQTGRSDIVLPGGGRMQGLLFDEALSGLFSASSTAGPTRGGAATQQFLAELAAVTLERPGDPRHLLVVTPRSWSPDPAAVTAALHAVRSAPWVSVRGLDELRATQPDATRMPPAHRGAARRAELPRDHVRAVAELDREAGRMAEALIDPQPVVDPLRERSLSLLASSWRTKRDELPAARAPLTRDVNALNDGVHIVRGSTILFLASKAALPVNVANGLPYPVRVQVTLRPRSGRLVVREPVSVELAANTRRQQVLVPTEAIASGDVLVEAAVRTPDGEVIGERVLKVRVRRDWETKGIIGGAAVLACLLVIGLLRGVRRDRTRVPPEAVPDVDDLASARGDRAAAQLDAIQETSGRPAPEPPTDHATDQASDEASGPPAPESRDVREPTMTSRQLR